MGQSIVAQIAELERMPIEELRVKWETLFDGSPPTSCNRKQLIAKLAYRIQELAFGGLSREARAKLEQIALVDMPDGNGKPAPRDASRPLPGTKFIREWQGKNIEVTVLDKGFECAGRRYRSLSAIATQFTGTKWNGYTFFGLRQRTSDPASSQTSRTEE